MLLGIRWFQILLFSSLLRKNKTLKKMTCYTLEFFSGTDIWCMHQLKILSKFIRICQTLSFSTSVQQHSLQYLSYVDCPESQRHKTLCFYTLIRPILIYNGEIWFMEDYLAYTGFLLGKKGDFFLWYQSFKRSILCWKRS